MPIAESLSGDFVYAVAAIGWDTLAARTIFSLPPALLAGHGTTALWKLHGRVVWTRQAKTDSHPGAPMVQPVMVIERAGESAPAEPVCILPGFHPEDPLRHHLALVLQVGCTAAQAPERLYADALTQALALHFVQRYASQAGAPRRNVGLLTPRKLRQVMAYIEDHLTQPLTLAEMAQVVQVSPTYFARQFKHATGLAPHQYIIRRRIERAQQCLRDTLLSCQDISQQVGFTDQSHFIAMFHRHVGVTPRAYRQQAQTCVPEFTGVEA